MKKLIYLEDAIDAIEKSAYRHTYLDQIIDIVSELPSAQPERKTGKWCKSYADHEAFGVRPFFRYCSCCNEITVHPYKYCPNCGARMEGTE